MRIRHLATMLVILAISCAARAGTSTSFDTDRHFTLGDPAGAQDPQFDDSGWTAVELPHDWSIAGPIALCNFGG